MLLSGYVASGYAEPSKQVELVNPLSYDLHMTVSERPLRADAERNRRRIMDAARELFAARGLDVTLNDIARHAGVGVGTDLPALPRQGGRSYEALFEERIAELEAIALAGLAMADPWEGIVATLTGVLELQEADRGFKELVLYVDRSRDGIAPIRARMAPVVAELMARAKAAGQLREDIGPQDFPLLQILLGAVIDVSRDASPGLWRRYLELILQGMRANRAHRRRWASPRRASRSWTRCCAAGARRGAPERASSPRRPAWPARRPRGTLPLPRVRADHGGPRLVDETQLQTLVPGPAERLDREHVRERDLAVQRPRGALRREPRAKSRDHAALEEEQPFGCERDPRNGTGWGPRTPRRRAAPAPRDSSRAARPSPGPRRPCARASCRRRARAGPCAADAPPGPRGAPRRAPGAPGRLRHLGRRIGHARLLVAVGARTTRL